MRIQIPLSVESASSARTARDPAEKLSTAVFLAQMPVESSFIAEIHTVTRRDMADVRAYVASHVLPVFD
jgi:hypothetical protein